MRVKKKLQKLKPVFKIIGYCCAGILFFTISIAAINHQQNTSCVGYNIHVSTANGMFFLNEEDVMQIIRDNNYSAQIGSDAGKVDYNRLEKIISNNPYAEKAEIILSPNGNVDVNVQQRVPILRVINRNGVGFYMDESGTKLPLSDKFTARVPVATGNILDSGLNEDFSDSALTKKLFQLSEFIYNDSFLNKLVEQIYVDDKNEVSLVPKIGDHIILFGGFNNYEEKRNKLFSFYTEGLNHVGWQNYSAINLKFRNQVYATRRDGVKTAIKIFNPTVIADSLQLNKPKPN